MQKCRDDEHRNKWMQVETLKVETLADRNYLNVELKKKKKNIQVFAFLWISWYKSTWIYFLVVENVASISTNFICDICPIFMSFKPTQI